MLFANVSETDSTQIEKVSLFYVAKEEEPPPVLPPGVGLLREGLHAEADAQGVEHVAAGPELQHRGVLDLFAR